MSYNTGPTAGTASLALTASALMGLAVAWSLLWLPAAWDIVARKRVARLRPAMERLSMDPAETQTFLRLWGLTMLGTFLGIWLLLGMPLVAFGSTMAIYLGPDLILQGRIRRRMALLRDQLARASISLANAVKAGMSLAQGLEFVARETPEPLARELRRIVGEYEHGRPLTSALIAAKERLALDSFTLFTVALLACLERGGNVADALDRISRSIQENQRLELKLEADTASGRKMMLILGAFPLVFLGLIYLLDPSGTLEVFQSVPGQLVLLVVGVLVAIAVSIARRILAIEI